MDRLIFLICALALIGCETTSSHVAHDTRSVGEKFCDSNAHKYTNYNECLEFTRDPAAYQCRNESKENGSYWQCMTYWQNEIQAMERQIMANDQRVRQENERERRLNQQLYNAGKTIGEAISGTGPNAPPTTPIYTPPKTCTHRPIYNGQWETVCN